MAATVWTFSANWTHLQMLSTGLYNLNIYIFFYRGTATRKELLDVIEKDSQQNNI